MGSPQGETHQGESQPGTGQPGTGQPGTTAVDHRLPIATAGASVAFLGRLLRTHWLLTAAVVITTVIGSGASLVAVLALSRVVDAVRAGEGTSILLTVAIAVAVAALVTAVFTAAGETLLATLIARLLATMRERVVAAVLCLPVARIERAGHGDALSRVGADVAVLVAGSRTAVPAIFSSTVLIAVSVAGLFTLDWRLALAGLAAAPAYVLAMRWYLPRSAPKYRAQRAAEADHIDRLVGGIDGLTTVRAYGLTARVRTQIDDAARSVRDISIAAFGVLERFVSRENRAEFIGLSLIIAVGWLLLRADAVSLGQVAAATLLFHRLFNPIGAILNFFDEAQRSGAALTRIVGVIDTADPGARPQMAPPAPGPVAVRVRDLTHRYEGTTHPAVDGVDLDIPAGTSLALVGASGAGKTTIASLVAGTTVGDRSGTIGFDDRDIATLSDTEIRSLVSVATQEAHLFAGSLAADLRLARPEATDDELWAALTEVGAAGWARDLPEGLDTAVGVDGDPLDPMKVAQVSLARLLLRDTPIVILDESSAEAGSRGAAALEGAALRVVRGRTALIVAHRLSQARTADAVAVIDEGRVREYGTHDDLVAAGGRYGQLWAAWSALAATDVPAPEDPDAGGPEAGGPEADGPEVVAPAPDRSTP